MHRCIKETRGRNRFLRLYSRARYKKKLARSRAEKVELLIEGVAGGREKVIRINNEDSARFFSLLESAIKSSQLPCPRLRDKSPVEQQQQQLKRKPGGKILV